MLNAIDRFEGEYFFLSNFYPCPVEYEGITYLSSESAFQAQKYENKEDRYKFCDLVPSSAKYMGRRIQLRKDWEAIKVNIMRNIVKAKFDQHPDLKLSLIGTKDYILVEGNNWKDNFWGIYDENGQNWLGIILMELRDSYLEN